MFYVIAWSSMDHHVPNFTILQQNYGSKSYSSFSMIELNIHIWLHLLLHMQRTQYGTQYLSIGTTLFDSYRDTYFKTEGVY
jgi:hypothetical protein